MILFGAGDGDGAGVDIERGGAEEAPPVVGDGLDEASLEGAFGSEGLLNALAVLVVGGLVLRRQDEHLAGEAVTVGVEGARIARFQFDLN